MSDPTDLLATLTTPADYIRWGATAFEQAELNFGHGFETALDEAYYLVRSVLALPHGVQDIYLQATLLLEEREAVLALLRQRIDNRIPAAYLTGESWFAGAAFYVDERVIVPRSPIAELIEQGFESWFADGPTSVLDLCCGSGCIGIATALHCPQAHVVVSDLSEDALAVAQINIEGFDLDARVEAVQGDLFASVPGRTFDLIVSNPPYVPTEAVDALPDEFDHEPRMSLESGADGLAHPGPILQQAAAHLNPGGWLILEVGAWADGLQAAFPQLAMEWISFERGGQGVCAVSRQALLDAGLA